MGEANLTANRISKALLDASLSGQTDAVEKRVVSRRDTATQRIAVHNRSVLSDPSAVLRLFARASVAMADVGV